MSATCDARRGPALFASKSLLAHLLRGVIAATLIAWMLLHQSPHPMLTTTAAIGAVVAMKGCPLCWTLGLLETVFRRPLV